MNKIKLTAFTLLTFLCFSVVQAQNDTLVNPAKTTEYEKLMDSNFKDSIAAKYVKTKTATTTATGKETKKKKKKKPNYSGNWIIGGGINMVEDSGHQTFSDLFTLKYKNLGAPFMLSAEYLASNRFSFSTTLLLNKYQAGKQIQGNIIQISEEPNYMAVDVAAKLFVRKVLYKHVFTPYVTAGAGYTSIGSYQAQNPSDNLIDIPETSTMTLNTGIGAYFWINRTLGINVNYMAKFGLKTGVDKNNHLVSSFGVFYRFDTGSN